MQSLLEIAVGILLAWFAVSAAKQALRQRLLRDRTDTLLGAQSVAKTTAGDGSAIDAQFMVFLEQLGLASGGLTIRVYLVLAPVGVAFAIAIFGWATGFGLLATLLVGHFIVIRWQRRRRTRQFTDGLPSLLERTRRLVMIGNTLPHALIEGVATADPLTKR
jgi:Flp pilus assembly protein TadB